MNVATPMEEFKLMASWLGCKLCDADGGLQLRYPPVFVTHTICFECDTHRTKLYHLYQSLHSTHSDAYSFCLSLVCAWISRVAEAPGAPGADQETLNPRKLGVTAREYMQYRSSYMVRPFPMFLAASGGAFRALST
jgi:hypothetical protein